MEARYFVWDFRLEPGSRVFITQKEGIGVLPFPIILFLSLLTVQLLQMLLLTVLLLAWPINKIVTCV